jgi:N,N'-diacetyllegionaminate synthase
MMNIFDEYGECYIVAEIGVNHGGDLEIAKKMIEAAKNAGADAVKFQSGSAENIVIPDAKKANYHIANTSNNESHYDMIKKLELSRENHFLIFDFCRKSEIDFISTPYDIPSVHLLEEIGIEKYKTASADLIDLPLHEELAKTGKPIIVAVGMGTMSEIEDVLNIYSRSKSDIILLHCISNYPCSHDSLNMNIMKTLHDSFQLPVGFSDHSVGSHAAIIATVMGAKIVEKHFTLDKNMSGPDHRASSTPKEFADLVKAIRTTEMMLGSGSKICQQEEYNNSTISRKSITIDVSIKKGHVIQRSDLTLKRPGAGLKAKELGSILGLKARHDLGRNYQPGWTDFE